MATLSPTAAFVHDCVHCRLLAHVKPTEGQAFDLYVCQAGSVVARTGDEGADYVSAEPALFAMVTAHHGLNGTLGRAIWLAEREAWLRGLMAL